MVLYTDVIKSVTKVLKDNFGLPVYGDEVKEGYKTPSFFVGMFPISSTTITKNYVQTELMIVVSYFSGTNDSVKNFKMMNDLKRAFGLVLKVENRRFTIRDIEIEKAGEDNDIFQFTFSINYHELMNFEEEPEVMKELIHKNRKVE